MNVFTEPAALGVEYIIKKYGKGRAHPPETGEVDNLYCAFRFPLTVLISNICAADTHYSESSLMPMLVNKLLFKIITEKSPFFIRPLLRAVFSSVNTAFLDPRLKMHADMVGASVRALLRHEPTLE